MKDIFGAKRPKGLGEYAPQLNFNSLWKSEELVGKKNEDIVSEC